MHRKKGADAGVWLLGFLKLPSSNMIVKSPEKKPIAEPASGSWWKACVARVGC